jgi:hypothetical protein
MKLQITMALSLQDYLKDGGSLSAGTKSSGYCSVEEKVAQKGPGVATGAFGLVKR